jgi:hypothetical protein
MTRARQNANISPAVGRNMVINGAMNVAQRSASVTGIGNAFGYATCDRWILGGTSSGRLTMTQTADGPNGISANCIKLDCTTADTSIAAGEYLQVQQRFEGFNLQRLGSGVAGAKQTTVSFYVKANAAFTFGCELENVDNSRQITKLFAVTTDWNRIELTFPADVDDGSSPYDDDNANGLKLSFWLHSGATYAGGTLNSSSWANTTQANRAAGIDSFYSSTDNNFFITGVQMEVGPVATDFEQEDISTTLAKCQRYFQRLEWAHGGMDVALQSTVAHGVYNVSYTTKRAAPSVTLPTPTVSNNQANGISLLASDGNYRSSSGSEAVAADKISKDNIRVRLTGFANSGAVGDATWAYYSSNASIDPYIDLDAEL